MTCFFTLCLFSLHLFCIFTIILGFSGSLNNKKRMCAQHEPGFNPPAVTGKLPQMMSENPTFHVLALKNSMYREAWWATTRTQWYLFSYIYSVHSSVQHTETSTTETAGTHVHWVVSHSVAFSSPSSSVLREPNVWSLNAGIESFRVSSPGTASDGFVYTQSKRLSSNSRYSAFFMKSHFNTTRQTFI